MKLNGERVREILKEREMTCAELARRVDITKEKMSQYLEGCSNCPRRMINNIADVLDVDWLEIVKFAGSYY